MASSKARTNSLRVRRKERFRAPEARPPPQETSASAGFSYSKAVSQQLLPCGTTDDLIAQVNALFEESGISNLEVVKNYRTSIEGNSRHD